MSLSQVHWKGDLGDEDDGKKGDTIMLLNGDDDGRPSEERQKSRAGEFRSRSSLKRSSPQTMRRFLWPSDSSNGCAQRRGCGWLAKAQATARVDVHTAPRQCCGLFIWDSLMSALFLSLRHRNPKERERRTPSRDRFVLREKNDVTVWDHGLRPSQVVSTYLPGTELKNDCFEPTLILFSDAHD